MRYLPLSHDPASWLGWLHFKAPSGSCYFGTMQSGNKAGRLLLLWLMSREDSTGHDPRSFISAIQPRTQSLSSFSCFLH
jgi:hypothetical protein